jgi:hypothetical protein
MTQNIKNFINKKLKISISSFIAILVNFFAIYFWYRGTNRYIGIHIYFSIYWIYFRGYGLLGDLVLSLDRFTLKTVSSVLGVITAAGIVWVTGRINNGGLFQKSIMLKIYLYCGYLINIFLWTHIIGVIKHQYYSTISYSQCYECDDFAWVEALLTFVFTQVISIVLVWAFSKFHKKTHVFKVEKRTLAVINHLIIQMLLLIFIFFNA